MYIFNYKMFHQEASVETIKLTHLLIIHVVNSLIIINSVWFGLKILILITAQIVRLYDNVSVIKMYCIIMCEAQINKKLINEFYK